MAEQLSEQPHIEVIDLSYGYGERLIFNNISLAIARGKITAIMGPSGTGKTTLLKLIGAQLRPDSGCILVDGVDIHRCSQAALYQARKKMGMLFQSAALFTNLSVFENVAFPLREHTHFSEHLIRTLALIKLQSVGLRGARDLMPSALSGGMARRVALARAIALDPELIMYDEPFAGQDPITLGVLVKLIKSLNQTLGMTSIVVSHDVPETASIADYLYILSGGKVVGEGTPLELNRHESPFVTQFIHGLPDGVVPFHYPAKEYLEDLVS